VGLVAVLASTAPLAATSESFDESIAPSALKTEWLIEVDLLLTPEERSAFLELSHDYQRRSFIEEFWRARDPFPQTDHNEFREVWSNRLEMAQERWEQIDGIRAQVFLLAGPPQQIITNLCPEKLKPMEIWFYSGAGVTQTSFNLVFLGGWGSGPRSFRLWSPTEGVGSLFSSLGQNFGVQSPTPQELARSCPRGFELAAALSGIQEWQLLLDQHRLVPEPSSEWLAVFMARSTDVPAEATLMKASVGVKFPARHQSRTVVQGLITLPRSEVEAEPSQHGEVYRLLVDGEVLRQNELFEKFRYRFDLPADETQGDQLALVIQRFLRPGDYQLVLRVKDQTSSRFFRSAQNLTVPLVERLSSTPEADDLETTAVLETETITEADSEASEVERRLAEANTGLGGSGRTITIQPPREQLHTGTLRVEARTSGEGIAKVTFSLNGRPVMSKLRAPYSVELDLGHGPQIHKLEAVAYDAAGTELARDQVPINAGPHHFGIRLVQPTSGKIYRDSLRARAELDLPRETVLDRVEFFVDETLIASLYQPPFAQPILLPQGKKVTYVRAVAYLQSGHSVEDLVFINAPDNLDTLNVHFVELYTTIVDRRGKPVDDLDPDQIVIREDGIAQQLKRFERVRDLPIHAGLLLDTSTSMTEELEEVEKAALQFFQNVIQPKDRAAVVVFNDAPELKVPLTNNLEVLAGGLSELDAEGETAFYDSLIYTLYYFSGLRGKRAIIVLSDGEDSSSRHSYDEAVTFAQRSGAAIYTIGIGMGNKDMRVRSGLERLARLTGGDAYFIARATELKSIYERIENELRTQYLLGYQSTQGASQEFRYVEVESTVNGIRTRTIPGYYP
jgi:Ca-activated chloride channel family protein